MKYCTVCQTKYEDSVSFCPVDGEVLEDDPSSIVNTVLDGQYQIEALLGKGGMGAVYRARHILLGDRVAIKILPPEVRTNAEWLRRFRREGQAARRFRHPNAVTVYDLRTAGDGTIYMVMEYVEGRTLDAEIKRRGSFTPHDALDVLDPIMSVLNTAHAMGVVHRDLKPENIMIGKMTTGGEPVVKLLDLGIAKMREIAGVDASGTTALTMAGQVLGTPYYMSPEQWGELPRDGNSEIDGRADIYSLGVVFYEMIAGKRPCSGNTLSELRREHVSVTPPPLHEVLPNVPPAFSQAIARATAKDRAERQETAGELAAELRAALNGLPAPQRSALADIPMARDSSQATSGVPGGRQTASDVDAPTVLTIDSEVTPVIAAPGGQKADQASLSASAPTITNAPDPEITVQRAAANDSSATMVERAPVVEQTPAFLPAELPKKSGKGGLIIGGVALVVVLLIAGVGGLFAYSWLKKDSGASAKNSGEPVRSVTTPTNFGRYWLELLPDSGATTQRVAGAVPLASGQKLRFHFQLEREGYLYIVGPGAGNQLTAFLSAQPHPDSGLTTNRVGKQQDFSFPAGGENSLTLDKNAGTEEFTIIFAAQQLTLPGFFAAPVTGEPLSEKDKSELTAFISQYNAPPVTELNEQDSSAPFIALKLPTTADSQKPVIFRIRIEHK